MVLIVGHNRIYHLPTREPLIIVCCLERELQLHYNESILFAQAINSRKPACESLSTYLLRAEYSLETRIICIHHTEHQDTLQFLL